MQTTARSSVLEASALGTEPTDKTDALWELVLGACEASGIDPKQLFSTPGRATQQGQPTLGVGPTTALPHSRTHVAIQHRTARHVVVYVDGAKCADIYGEHAESDAMLLANARR